MRLTSTQLRAIRHSLGGPHHTPIQVIPGIALAPQIRGDSWGYETITGIPIRHPSAYRKRGWSSIRYIASTRRVEVGEDWLRFVTARKTKKLDKRRSALYHGGSHLGEGALGGKDFVWREGELEVGDVIPFVSRIVKGLRTTRTDTPLKVVREVSSEEYADWAVSAGITPGPWRRAAYYEVAAE